VVDRQVVRERLDDDALPVHGLAGLDAELSSRTLIGEGVTGETADAEIVSEENSGPPN
jgi:hypothetical protein